MYNKLEEHLRKIKQHLKMAGNNSLKNGASLNDVDKPDQSSMNFGKKRPLFSEKMETNSPYNTE